MNQKHTHYYHCPYFDETEITAHVAHILCSPVSRKFEIIMTVPMNVLAKNVCSPNMHRHGTMSAQLRIRACVCDMRPAGWDATGDLYDLHQ